MSITRIQRYIFFLLVFLIPTNLFVKFLPSTAYVHGILVDYLIPKIYLQEILIGILFVLDVIKLRIRKKKHNFFLNLFPKKNIYFLSLLIVFFVTQLISSPYKLGLFSFILMCICSLYVIFFLLRHKKFFSSPSWTKILTITLLFQSGVATLQYILQRSLLGFAFFGETTLGGSAQIAKGSLFGSVRILPYGTTPHPNILAGILTFFILLMLINTQRKTVVQYMICLWAVGVIFLTGSISAIAALVLGSIVFIIQKTKLWHFTVSQLILFCSVLYVFITTLLFVIPVSKYDSSFARRTQLEHIAVTTITTHPLIGVGLNQFSSYVSTYGGVVGQIQFLQPVHNIGLLILAETGLLGFIILFLFYIKEHNKYTINMGAAWIIFPAIIIIASLDHYMYSLLSGQLLAAILLAYLYNKKEK